MAEYGQIAAAGISAGANIFGTWLGNKYAKEREEQARAENYKYNELAAQNADARTRALYNDLYSPSAQLQQIKDAGLSPSLFYGDGGGISGQSGAMGSGASGISPQVFGAPQFDFTQLAKSIAEVDLIKAQTQKTKSETTFQDMKNEVTKIENGISKRTMELMTSYIELENTNGERIATRSMFEEAEDAISYEEFVNKIEKSFENVGNDDMRQFINGEQGNSILRNIYYAANKLSRDINVLTHEEIDASFQTEIINALRKLDYEGKNAQAVSEELNNRIEQAKLSSNQKQAWNNIMSRLKKRNSEASDWVIVLSLIVDRAMSNYVNINRSYNQNVKQ